VSHDVEDAAYFSLQVVDLIAAGIEVNNPHRFLRICGHDKSIHDNRVRREVRCVRRYCRSMTNAPSGVDGQVLRLPRGVTAK
jgi:hypothetical protein